jgi:hypothetical protein
MAGGVFVWKLLILSIVVSTPRTGKLIILLSTDDACILNVFKIAQPWYLGARYRAPRTPIDLV